MAVKRILVPIDFSRDSLHALAYARDLAERFAAELLILHVVDQTYLAGAPELTLANPRFAEFLQEQWRIATEQVQRLASSLSGVAARRGPTPVLSNVEGGSGSPHRRRPHARPRVRTLVKRGTASQVIVDTAKRSATDLIVMATHGRTGLAHMLIGSVAERVVRSAHCAVLTVRRASKRQRTFSTMENKLPPAHPTSGVGEG